MLRAPAIRLRPRPVVFKRWSRAPYAVMRSLHREVVVGRVKVDICYASMLKQGILMNENHCPQMPRRTDPEDDDGSGGRAWPPGILLNSTIAQDIEPRHLAARDGETWRDCPNSACDSLPMREPRRRILFTAFR